MSFTECMCRYFDDLNFGVGLESALEEEWLSRAEAEALAQFHHMAEAYKAPPGGDAAVLRDPKWSEVVRSAQQAWLAVTKCIADIGDRECVEELESRWGRIAETPL